MLKNPFGIRDGEYVTISDIEYENRGRKCNCVCPFCGDKFEAKMGNVKIHHFAHCGDTCDEEKAYMSGLYGMLKEYIDSGNPIVLPPIYLELKKIPRKELVKNLTQCFFNVISEYDSNAEFCEKIKNGKTVVFTKSELNYNDEQNIVNLVAFATGKEGKSSIVIEIIPPKNTGKPELNTDKNISKIRLDFSDCGELMYKWTKSEFFNFIKNNPNIVSWTSSTKAFENLEEIKRKICDKAEEIKIHRYY